MATLYKADGTKEEFKYPTSLENMQQAVKGWIEYAYMPDGSAFIVNEEGKLKGLPYNERATHIYQRTWYLTGVRNEDFLAGDAILVSEQELAEDRCED